MFLWPKACEKTPKKPKSQRSVSHRHQKLLWGLLERKQDGTMGPWAKLR